MSHSLTLGVDEFGNVLQLALLIGYGRRHDDPDPSLTANDREKQKRTLATLTENEFTNPVLSEDDYRAPLACGSRTYELLSLTQSLQESITTNLFQLEELLSQIHAASDEEHDLPYEDIQASGARPGEPYRRLIERTHTFYRKNDLSGPLSLGQLESRALPFESYRLAFTPSLIAQVYGQRVSDTMLADEGKYVHLEGDANWWIPSGRSFYSRNPSDTAATELTEAGVDCFLVRRSQDAFGNNTFVYFDIHDLLVTGNQDALQSVIVAAGDYRVLASYRVTDPNGNRAEVAFDTLGMVVGTALMGKESEAIGDLLDDAFNADLDDATILGHIANPLANPWDILQKASTRLVYDLFAYQRTGIRITRSRRSFMHSRAKPTISISAAMNKPRSNTLSPFPMVLAARFKRRRKRSQVWRKRKMAPEKMTTVDTTPNLRWVGSGWLIFNNKGKPARRYQPFFSTHNYFQLIKESVLVLFCSTIRSNASLLHSTQITPTERSFSIHGGGKAGTSMTPFYCVQRQTWT